ncbi:MAG: hypothetical protein JNJ70_26090 [Verrucomicrobiales bacterium]|nr:hypothetical protein [Verrucomicrobiales bacterium]
MGCARSVPMKKKNNTIANAASPHPIISLTDFVDFVAKTGRPKMTLVKQVKQRPEYDPKEDFWRRLRSAIVDYHKSGSTDKTVLGGALDGVTHKPKESAYPAAIKGYQKFLGRKAISWYQPPTKAWTSGDLTIRVNPELGLVINGEHHLVKLYFKADAMTKTKADVIILLMREAIPNLRPGTKFALLDVQRAKLFAHDSPSQDLLPLLQGEAANFATIWASIPDLPARSGLSNAA